MPCYGWSDYESPRAADCRLDGPLRGEGLPSGESGPGGASARPEEADVAVKSCPHADIRHCPLYIAAHMPIGLGCMDGKEDSGSCGVARKVSYARNVERLKVKQPGLVEKMAWREEVERVQEQRKRNLRLNGIH